MTEPASDFGSTRARLCLIVPCHNEAQRLDSAKFREFLEKPFGLLCFLSMTVVPTIQSRFSRGYAAASKIPHTYYEVSTTNGGKAEAVRRGILYGLDDLKIRKIGSLGCGFGNAAHIRIRVSGGLTGEIGDRDDIRRAR